MLKDNLVMLRSIHGYSQEQLAEKINISRQAYAKWESGATVPDIEKCALLAEIYGVTVDSLIEKVNSKEYGAPLLAPKGKNIWGRVSINERGQIVIPKDARDKFNLTPGSHLVVLGDEEGIALVPLATFESNIQKIMELAGKSNESN